MWWVETDFTLPKSAQSSIEDIEDYNNTEAYLNLKSMILDDIAYLLNMWVRIWSDMSIYI